MDKTYDYDRIISQKGLLDYNSSFDPWTLPTINGIKFRGNLEFYRIGIVDASWRKCSDMIERMWRLVPMYTKEKGYDDFPAYPHYHEDNQEEYQPKKPHHHDEEPPIRVHEKYYHHPEQRRAVGYYHHDHHTRHDIDIDVDDENNIDDENDE